MTDWVGEAEHVESVAVLFDDGAAGRSDAARELARRWVSAAGGHIEVRLEAVRPDDRRVTDPYGLQDRIPLLGADSVALVAPRRRGTRRLAPGPMVAGVPVGTVQADDASQLPADRGRPDPATPWVVAAMAKNVFLDATERWSATLANAHPTVDLRADRARRDDLLDGLRVGPGVVLYAGHGSPRGWAGYQALRVEHVAPTEPTDPAPIRPMGFVMAFACQTLARNRGRWPFGSQLVERGVASAYLAPAMNVYTADAECLASLAVDLLAEQRATTVADLMVLIEGSAARHSAARRAWATFRLVGNPLTPIV